jgi:hypothetical protein
MRILFVSILLLCLATQAFSHQPVIVGEKAITIDNPEISRAFYHELSGQPRSYFINSDQAFDLYINLLVPKNTNPSGRYSAHIYKIENGKRILLHSVDGQSVTWREFFEPFGGDTYLKGPEWKQAVPAGSYGIEVFSADNRGKYVLAVGEKEFFGPKEIANVYVEVPRLKGEFFGESPWGFLLTPFGIIAVIVVGGMIYLLFRK